MNTKPRRGLALVAVLVALPLLVVGTLLEVGSSLGPVNIGSYSLSGPRTWTQFPVPARVVFEAGGYKVWQRQAPTVVDGS